MINNQQYIGEPMSNSSWAGESWHLTPLSTIY